MPNHVAIIPDGNRRWAKSKGLGVVEAHKAGYETLKKMADAAVERGITTLTVYAFSTENWQRTRDEVGALLKLLEWGLKNEVKHYHKRGVRLNFWGRRDDLPGGLAAALNEAEKLTHHNANATFNICFNYGGRADIVAAVNRTLESGVKAVDEEAFANYLVSAGTPDPDLIIRTSGEQRLSNFLPWEGAYSELYFTDTLWPEFDEAELDKALAEYANRGRRFGQ
ncbi:MAG TPA: polyprenyl diphosphate synthase [Candidatus Saccharimonadales bacterium]|nr:polyprenyl diphosphate synthase [Candidatus Saccharimonadales bacterium]